MLKKLPEKVRRRCLLPELQREYTLYEIAIITRAGPARMLGLPHKGHLGIGADADITIYTPGKDVKAMFELPRYVLKAGEVVVENGELRAAPFGPALHVQPRYDEALLADLKPWFEQHYTVAFANYPVDDIYLTHGGTVVDCKGTQ
jgi:formylmethanofuran dehydrogenase subunit A